MLDDPMQDISTSSLVMILDFTQITDDIPVEQNMKHFFEVCKREGKNPRLPENRQAFNNRMLHATGKRYLISRYAEDRSAMLADTQIYREGRTIHLGVDIFAENTEEVYAPSDGDIVATGYEAGFGEYGHYLIFKPSELDVWFFFGHLSKRLSPIGAVKKGDIIARLGDYANNENGGWSRHLHVQAMREYSPENGLPPGYSMKKDLKKNSILYPDPSDYFTDWQISPIKRKGH